MKNTNIVSQSGSIMKTKESMNIKNAINKYNIKLSELRKKMQSSVTYDTFGKPAYKIKVGVSNVQEGVKKRAESGGNINQIEFFNTDQINQNYASQGRLYIQIFIKIKL